MKILFYALIAASLMFTGCATMRTSHAFNGVKIEDGRTPLVAVEIENTGWYLFCCIPIIAGDTSEINEWSWRWFTDTVTLQNNLNALDQKMQDEGANEVANLNSYSSNDSYYFFLISRRAYHTSAVLLREKDQK